MRRLVISLAVIVLSVPVSARYGGGSGTAGDPYRIADANDLVLLGNSDGDWGKHFVLVNDIDLAGVSISRIGYDYHEGNYFIGSFDGGGHVIRNLTMDLPGVNYVGLFGYIEDGGEIRNLGLEEVSLTGEYLVGGLVGRNYEGTITNCFSSGSVSGDYYVGGLVGGSNEGTITNCYSTVAVSGNLDVGGLVGSKHLGAIRNCYSTGLVSGNVKVGGLLGYSAGKIEGCFWDAETSGMIYSDGGIGLKTNEMQDVLTFSYNGWAGDDWTIAEGEYPRLTWEGAGGEFIPEPGNPFEGSGTVGDPWRITAAEDFLFLGRMSLSWDEHFVLTDDIDLAGLWVRRIGYNSDNYFVGSFDGGAHVIRNLTIDLPEVSFVGLFGYVGDGGAIRNLHLDGLSVSGDRHVGGLVGRIDGGTIANCHRMGTVRGGINVGGLVGYNQNGSVINCVSTGSVSGEEYVGGLVGHKSRGEISGCYSHGSVTGERFVGGLVGGNTVSTITKCCSTVLVSGDYAVGGLVGRNNQGTITDNYSTGSVIGEDKVGGLVGTSGPATVTNCYSTGAVNGGSRVGGLVGNIPNTSITSCYFLETSGFDNGIGEALSEEAMRMQASFVGWDFVGNDIDRSNDAWKMIEGVTMPLLLSDASLVFVRTLEGGENPEDHAMRFCNRSEEEVSWYIDALNLPDWLEVLSLSGTVSAGSCQDVPVSFNTAELAFGVYRYLVDIYDSSTMEIIDVTGVLVDVVGPIIELSQSDITFWTSESYDDDPTGQIVLSNGGGGVLDWFIEPNSVPDWLLIEPPSGVLGADDVETVSISVDAADLAAGRHTCELIVSSAYTESRSKSVKVALVVSSTGEFWVPYQYNSIQGAIDAAADGDLVVVADGIYTGVGNRDLDFKGKAITVRSENGAENCIIDCQRRWRGFYFHSSEGVDSVLEGFTITRGRSDIDTGGHGAGIACDNQSGPTIRNCIITECYAGYTIDLEPDPSDPDNGGSYTSGFGGAIYGSRGPIVGCVIRDNSTGGWGGGLYNCDGSIIDCTIVDNSVPYLDTTFGGAGFYGGGGLSHCDGEITHCVISGNSFSNGFSQAQAYGSAAYGCSGTISNCIVAGNWGDGIGALRNCHGEIVNCTIVDNMLLGVNYTHGYGAGVDSCNGRVRNCIIRNNQAEIEGGNPVVTFSNVKGGWEGEGNIDVDALFADPNNGDYHLKSEAGRWNTVGRAWVYDDVTSGCIDGGDPNTAWCGEFWPHGGRVNMGAYGGTSQASMSLDNVGNVADLDCDGGVGFLDFGLFAGQWGFDAGAWWAQSPPYRGDLDRDGFAGLADLAVLVEEWVSD